MEIRFWCGAVIGAESPKPSLAEPNRYIIFRGLDTTSFHRVSIFIFLTKRRRIGCYLKKKPCRFMLGFQISTLV